MTGHVAILDSFTRVTPFGARFWDGVTQRFIGDGLKVTAYAGSDTRRPPLQGIANRSGVFLLAGLPGIHHPEMGAGDADYWSKLASPPDKRRPFRVEVTDSQKRFLPYYFVVPLPIKEFVTPSCPALSPLHSPPQSPPWQGTSYLPLFSAPERPIPGATAVVRAELRDATTGVPAAWALVTVVSNGVALGTALADQEGRVTLPFSYPEPIPKHLARASPPPLTIESSWQVEFQAYYERRQPPAVAVPALEDLCTLMAQPRARLLHAVSPPTELPVQELRYGEELVLKSDGSPYLFVEPV